MSGQGGRKLDLVPKGDGTYELRGGGTRAAGSARPRVAGASAQRAPGGTAEPCPLGALKVKVVRADTGAAVAGVRVAPAGLDPKTTARGSGEASWDKVPAAGYVVALTLRPAAARMFFAPDPQNISVARSSQSTLTVHLEPAAALRVAVRIKGASPARAVPGVAVKLARANDAAIEADTDADGAVAFDPLTPGAYTLDLDLGDATPRFRPFAPEQITAKGGDKLEKTIELDALSCALTAIRITEILAKEDRTVQGTFPTEDKRVFRIRPGGARGGGGGGSAIDVDEGRFVWLTAPRFNDLFKDPTDPAVRTQDPAAALFSETVKPTWIAVEVDATPHERPPDTALEHPRIQLRSGSGPPVAEAAGEVRLARRALVAGPDLDIGIGRELSDRGLWIKRLGLQLGEILSAGEGESAQVTPRHYDLFVDYCDETGDPQRARVPIAVLPGDEYELSLNIPPVVGYSAGVSGDYIRIDDPDDAKAKEAGTTRTQGASALGSEFWSHSEQTTDKGKRVVEVESGTATETAPDGTVSTADRPWATKKKFAEALFNQSPLIDLTRNGRRDPAYARLVDFCNLILWCSTDAKKYFGDVENVVPKFGWWVTFDISLLTVAIKRKWGFRPKQTANGYDFVSSTKIDGKVLAVAVKVKAGLECAVVPRTVYFRAIVYLELGGDLNANVEWVSTRSSKEIKHDVTIKLKVGVDCVVGNANFCQAEGWIEAPYTWEWQWLPPDHAATPPRLKWTTDTMKGGCKDGIHIVMRYMLFYGKYSGTKKVRVKKPDPKFAT